jgi:hypothetical protein
MRDAFRVQVIDRFRHYQDREDHLLRARTALDAALDDLARDPHAALDWCGIAAQHLMALACVPGGGTHARA